MPDLIQVADDIKQMPDGWLAKQAQQPTGDVPPYLVIAEIQRREKLRSGAAKAQAPTSSVAQDMIKSLYARIPPTAGLIPQQQPQGAIPPGVPPVNLSGSPGSFGPAAGAPPPGGMRMPARGMAYGGEYDDYGEGGYGDEEEDDPLAREPGREQVMRQLYQPPEAQAQAPVEVAADNPQARLKRLRPYDKFVEEAAKDTGLDPHLIRGVMSTESNGNPRAVSPKGAIGLMQIMPATAKGEFGLEPEDLLDPSTNILAGARYLKKLIKQHNGDVTAAIEAYNTGAAGRARGVRAPGYVKSVTGHANAFQSLGGGLFRKPEPEPEETGMPDAPMPGGQDAPLLDEIAGGNVMPQMPQMPQMPPRPEAMPATSAGTAAPFTPAPEPGAMQTPGFVPGPLPAAGSPVIAQFSAPGTQPAAAPQPLFAKPPEDPRVASLNKELAQYQEQHKSVDQRVKDMLGESPAQILGKRPDYSKQQAAIERVMAMAERQMHPSIGSSLIAFGSAMLASRSPSFWQAFGEASQHSAESYDKQVKQGMSDFLDATKASVSLQDKMQDYDQQVARYRIARINGINVDERAAQAHIASLERQRDTAQAAVDKAFSGTPMGRLAQVNQYHRANGEPDFDPNTSPAEEKKYIQYGTKPSATAANAPAMNHNAAITLAQSANPEEKKRGEAWLAAETEADVKKATQHQEAVEGVKLKFAQQDMPSLAQAVADYDMPFAQAVSRGGPGAREKLESLVKKINPSWQAWQYDLFKTVEAKMSSDPKRVTVNNAVLHMGDLYKAINALESGNVQILNRIAQGMGKQVGATPAATFKTIAGAVGPELTKAYVPEGGTEKDRAENTALFDPSLPPQQLRENLLGRARLLISVANNMQANYKEGTYGRGKQHVLFERPRNLMNEILHLKPRAEIQAYAQKRGMTFDQALESYRSHGWELMEE